MSQWPSWSEMAAQYKDTELRLVTAKESAEKAKRDTSKKSKADKSKEIVNCELLASMLGSTRYTLQEVEKKLLYDLGTFSESELELLTDQERQIAELKQKYSNRHLAEILNISASHVQTVHKRVINKLKRIHSLNNRGFPLGLSRQQERIFIMHFKEKRAGLQIAKKLKISLETVQKQIEAIRKLV